MFLHFVGKQYGKALAACLLPGPKNTKGQIIKLNGIQVGLELKRPRLADILDVPSHDLAFESKLHHFKKTAVDQIAYFPQIFSKKISQIFEKLPQALSGT